MTTPNVIPDNFIQSYVLAASSSGFQFARAVTPKAEGKSHEIPVPVGVNTVQVVYSGATGVVVSLTQPKKETLRPSRLQIPDGEGTRMVLSEVPVSEPGSMLIFTIRNALASEVGQPILGVKIFPAPPPVV